MPSVRIEHQSKLPAYFTERGFTLKNSMPGLLRQTARSTAVSLAFQAQPFGDDDKAQALGQVATNRDVYRVYATPGKAFEDLPEGPNKAFWKAVKRSAWDRAQAILAKFGSKFKSTPIQGFDGGAAHQSLRNNRGRIPASQKPAMIVRNPTQLASYVKLETNKVGAGKGGWATCAAAVGGTRGIPRWITKHKSPGSVVENYGDGAGQMSVTMTNHVPYASTLLTGPQKSEAIDIAYDKLLKSIRIAESFAARKANHS